MSTAFFSKSKKRRDVEMKIETERYYTIKELGAFLFSEKTWRRRIKNNEITYLKTGVLLVKGEWIEQYLLERRVDAKI
jgi:hypothetical protein